MKWEELKDKLKLNPRVQKEKEIYVQASAKLPYAVVVTAMAIAKDAGVAKVMLLTDPADTLPLKELDQNTGP